MNSSANTWLASKGFGPLTVVSPPTPCPAAHSVVSPPASRPAALPEVRRQRRLNKPIDVLPLALSMPIPSTTLLSITPVVVSPVDVGDHGVWAALAAPGLRVEAVAVSFAEADVVTSGLWLPSSSHYTPPTDLGPLAHWTGAACPEPVARLLAAKAPVISYPLTVAQQVLSRLGWGQPAQWLDVTVQLCTANLDGELDEVAAWLAGKVDLSAWSMLRGFTGVVTPQEPLAGSMRQAVAMTRVALGVAARCGVTLGTAAEDEAWEVDQIINARGLPFDRTLIKRVLSLAPSPEVANKFAEVAAHACPDDRVRGVFGFVGQHTGRWTACKPAVHNVRKIVVPSDMKDDAIRAEIQALINQVHLDGSLPTGSPEVQIGNLERAQFCAPDGMTFVVGDQKQAEPRGVFYFAGMLEILELMDRIDLYLEPTLQKALFGDVVTVDHPDAKRRRTVLKIAIIGCGFGMGAPTLNKYALNNWGFDLKKEGVDPARVVGVYRHLFRKVQSLWYALGEQSLAAVGNSTPIQTAVGTFEFVDGDLLSRLHSGRVIVYPRAKIVEGKKGYGKVMEYWKGGPLRGKREEAWGGILFQHAVTGTLRDVHAGHLVGLEIAGLNPVGHCHDEAVGLVLSSQGSTAATDMAAVMNVAPSYLPGLQLRCTPYLSERLGVKGLKR